VPTPAEPATNEAQAVPAVAELVKLKQNPVSGLNQIVFEANANPGYPRSGTTQGLHSLQVVWPFSLNEDYRLVSYTILPVLHLPGAPGEGRAGGAAAAA